MCVSLFVIKDKSFFIYSCMCIVYLLGLMLLQVNIKEYQNFRLDLTRELCVAIILVMYLGLMLLVVGKGLI